jgi:toxin ParE1/3/4
VEITFSQSAISDLEVGNDLVISVFAHIETLIDHPDISRVVPEFGEEHIRELIHPPYRIVYLRGLGSLQIIRIWRSERLLEINQVNQPLAVYK